LQRGTDAGLCPATRQRNFLKKVSLETSKTSEKLFKFFERPENFFSKKFFGGVWGNAPHTPPSRYCIGQAMMG
jgi:hypothetical protein